MSAAPVAEHTIVIPDGIAPPDRRFWVTPEMIRRDSDGIPVLRFNVHEFAKFFFGRSGSWLRLRMRPDPPAYPQGYFVLDGQQVLEPQRTPGDARVFSLADVEPMAYALAQNGVIDPARLVAAVTITKWEARLHGLLLEEKPDGA